MTHFAIFAKFGVYDMIEAGVICQILVFLHAVPPKRGEVRLQTSEDKLQEGPHASIVCP